MVGAYYDGLGTVDGRLYPGADANASGVAALISLAHNAPSSPRDGIIFVAFDGHSSDYAGARDLLRLLGSITDRIKGRITGCIRGRITTESAISA